MKIEKPVLQGERNAEIENLKQEVKFRTFCIMDLQVIILCVMKVIVKTSLNRAKDPQGSTLRVV